MLIEIHGAGFGNKGAQLMLGTVVDRLRARFPNAEVCIAVGSDRPYREVAKIGAKYIWPSRLLDGRRGKYGPLFKVANVLSSCVSEARLASYGLVKRSQVDAMLDISGFAFSDMWGPTPMRNFCTLANSYSKRNCPVVMLPQMLGPFVKPENAILFKKMVSHCSLVYTRDQQSFEIAKECLEESTKLRKAPDITLFQPDAHPGGGPAGSDDDSSTRKVLLVPNMRVLDMGTAWDEAKYLEMFKGAGRQAINAGYQVQILIHETFGKDAMLARNIARDLSLPESCIFGHSDPKVLKQEIAKGAFLLGSRFHSLASALSTGTPSIAIGWAHKYGELLKDFGVAEFDIPSVDDSERIPSLVSQLLQDTQRKQIVSRLQQSKISLAKTNAEMWHEIFNLLEACA